MATVPAGTSWARGVTKSAKIHMSGNATYRDLASPKDQEAPRIRERGLLTEITNQHNAGVALVNL